MQRLLATLLFLTITAALYSQQRDVESLPDDPRVKSGTLANGLSYILIKNDAVKGYADFCLAQKCGTVLESKEQTGMFELLEALMLKGTRNFPGSEISEYLRKLGVLSDNIIFSTEEDNITYLIKDIPVARENTIDSSLLILYNWIGSLNIDEEDIKEETPFVKSELINRWDAQTRLDEQLLGQLYPESAYAESFRPEYVDMLDNYTSKEVREFYYKWFRPDMQAIIVAGDIDPALLEAKIKSTFVTIPKPMEEQPREYYTPPTLEGTNVALLKDREYSKTKVSINLLKTPLPESYRNTSVPFIQEYFDTAIEKLLADRIREGSIAQNIPIANLEISKGRFLDIWNSENFSITFETLPSTVYSAVSFVNSEIVRAAQYGFTSREISKSKDIYFRELENKYDNRAMLGNDIYLQRALDHFYNGSTLASIELKFEIMKQILFTITQKQVNGYANALLSQEDNVVICCMMPEYSDASTPTAERILAAYDSGELITPEATATEQSPVIFWPDFAGNVAGSIVREITDPISGALVAELSNGAVVILKSDVQTKSDTILFKAISKGGFSLMNGITPANVSYLNEILNIGGLGNISRPNMERLFSYYDLSVDARITQNTEELYGYASRASLEKLFHAIYMNMAERRADDSAFETYRQGKIYELKSRALSPENAFRDTLLYYSYSNKKSVEPVTAEMMEKLNYAALYEQTRERFANAADFIFIFSGNFDNSLALGYAVKYIGSIPGNQMEREEWMVMPNYLTKGHVFKRFLYNMVTPKTYMNVTLSYGVPYTIENYTLARFTERYIRSRLLSPENRRLATHARINASLNYYPEEIVTLNTIFTTDSLNAAALDSIVESSLSDLAYGKADNRELSQIRQNMQEEFAKSVGNSYYWINALEYRYVENIDFHTGYGTLISSITQEQLQKFARDLLEKGNKISVIMDGTTDDVNTRNLFREDKFIREFFGIE